MTVLSAQSLINREIVHPPRSASHDSQGNSFGLSACGYDIRVKLLSRQMSVPWTDTIVWRALSFWDWLCIHKKLPHRPFPKPCLVLWPHAFVLVAAFEYFEMPHDVVGIVHDKSSLARRRLAVQNTVLEPGWRGYLTLEITNHSWWFNRLYDECAIAQVLFHTLDQPTTLPYSGKYQDQEAGPQEAR